MKKYLIKDEMKNSVIFLSLTTIFGGGEVFLYNMSIILEDYDLHFCICNEELMSRLIERGVEKKKILLMKNESRFSQFGAAMVALRYASQTGVRKIVFNGIAEIKYAPFFKLAGFSTFSVIHTEQFAFQNLIRKFVYFLGYICVNKIIFVASHLIADYQKSIKKKSFVIINRIIYPFASMKRISVNKTTIKEIVYIGRVSKSKGINDIFSIAVHHPSIHFKLVGPLTKYSEDLRNNVPQNVTLTGFDTCIEGHLRSADAIIFPSRSEGMPYAVLEAACIGLPVIASIIPAHEEIATFIRGIRFYQAGNISALNEVLIDMKSYAKRNTVSQELYESSIQFNDKINYARAFKKVLNIADF